MNEMMIFGAAEFGQIRATIISGEPWFVGKDIAEALGYKNSRKALADHVDDEDKNTVTNRDGNKGNPNIVIINESGLYSLIFSSKLESARAFKRWVTSEILPSIRKTGKYTTANVSMKLNGGLSVNELFSNSPDGVKTITSNAIAEILGWQTSSINRLIRKRADEINKEGGNVGEYFFIDGYRNSMNVYQKRYRITPKGCEYIATRLIKNRNMFEERYKELFRE